MKTPAQAQTSPRHAPLLEETVFLDLVRTADSLSRPVAQLLKGSGLSPAQYNVLRILRGSPEGLTCGDIANRMITRDPDITRLLDRIEKRDLISRGREERDRRIVLARITAAGWELLTGLDQPVRAMHRRLLGRLGAERLSALRELLEACRAEVK